MLRNFSSGATEDLNFFHSELLWRNHLSLWLSAVIFIFSHKQHLVIFTSPGRARKAKTHCSCLPCNILYLLTYLLEIIQEVHLNQEIYFSGCFSCICFWSFLCNLAFRQLLLILARLSPWKVQWLLFLSQRDLRAGEICTETVILLQISQTCTVKGKKRCSCYNPGINCNSSSDIDGFLPEYFVFLEHAELLPQLEGWGIPSSFFFFSFLHLRGRKGRKRSGVLKCFSDVAKGKTSVNTACIARVGMYTKTKYLREDQ